MKTDGRRRDGWQRARLTVPPTEGGADERGPERKGDERERRECAPASSESSGSVGAAAVRVGRPGGRAESGIGARRRRPDERPKKVGQIR